MSLENNNSNLLPQISFYICAVEIFRHDWSNGQFRTAGGEK